VSVLVTDLENLGMEAVAFFDVEDTEGTFFDDTLLLVIDVEGTGAVMDAVVTGAAVDAAGVTVEAEILLRFVDADLEGGICFLVVVVVAVGVFRFLPLPSTLTFVSICMILKIQINKASKEEHTFWIPFPTLSSCWSQYI